MTNAGDILSTMGVFSTVGDVTSTIGVILSTLGVLSTVEDIIMHMGDIMSTVGGGVFSTMGRYHPL